MPRIIPACVIAGVVIVGDFVTSRRRSRGRLHRLRQAEVQHLHRAVGAHLDVRGLQIAMDDPLLVRGFERLRDLLRDRQRLVERDRAPRDPLRQVLALDEFHHERGARPPTSRDRRSRRCADDSATRASSASRWNRASRSASARTTSGRTLIATWRSSFVSRRPIHLAHAAFANWRGDLVDAEAGARCEGQRWRDYRVGTEGLADLRAIRNRLIHWGCGRLEGDRRSVGLPPVPAPATDGPRSRGAAAHGSARAVSSPKPDPLEDATWVHRRVDAPRRGELEVENRREREQPERQGLDAQGAQDSSHERKT